MFKNFLFITLVLVKMLLCAEETKTKVPLPSISESELGYFQMFVDGNNHFAFELYQVLKQRPGNLYFSSYGIATGLGMVAIGAKGETAAQFRSVFHYSSALFLFAWDMMQYLHGESQSNRAAQVLFANALWVDNTTKVLSSFNQALMRNFHDSLQKVEFSRDLSGSVQKVNDWLLKMTSGNMSHILFNQDVTMNTRMLLTTATYIKGKWAFPFDVKLTKKLRFQITPRRTQLCDMMQKTANYLLFSGQICDCIVIPFESEGQDTGLSMAILLPKKNIPLAELEKKFTLENWKKWKSELKSQLVQLSLPTFRIDNRLDLEPVLRALGLTKLFNTQANLTGITEEAGLYLNAAIHKNSIRIGENGVDGSAANSLKSVDLPQPGKSPYVFIADRPFIFVIWDQKTDSIISLGRLTLP